MPYTTNELEIASFLKATGVKLLGAKLRGSTVDFEFESGADGVERYFAGEAISARELFEAHRSLRTLIKQVKDHSNYRNGEKYGQFKR